MNIDEYEKWGRDLYARFADVVAEILNAAIKSYAPPLRYQYIQRRAKNVDSLKKKLDASGEIDSNDIGDSSKDLAGCRIVFYSNADVTRFLNSPILHTNFEIDGRRTKPHYPIPEITDPSNQFRSDNIVIRLRESREALPEYSEFHGMWCEVQIQTILNHSWSETAHDITYKRPELKGVGDRLLKNIDARLQKIMSNYLSPAGYEFQKSLDDYDLLVAAQKLIDDDAVGRLVTSANNNERLDLLEDIRKILIPNLDDVLGSYPNIRDKIIKSIDVARESNAQPIEIHGVKISDGRSFEDYLEAASEALRHFRNVDVKGNIEVFLSLYAKSSSESEREKFITCLTSLANYDLNTWEKVGPGIQIAILARLKEIPHASRKDFLPLITRALGEILNFEIDGTSSTYDAVTISFGIVPADDTTSKIRDEAITLLIDLYGLAASLDDKRLIIAALSAATRQPTRGNYTDDILAEVIKNSERLVKFYSTLVESEHFEILRIVEKQAFRLWKNFVPLEDHKEESRPSVVRSARALKQAINNFRNPLNAKDGFLIFKAFIGYDPVYEMSWAAPEDAYDAINQYRDNLIKKYVVEITVENLASWREIISSCAAVASFDLSLGMAFFQFLKLVGSNNPGVGFRLVSDQSFALSNFTHVVLEGLFQSHMQDDLEQLIREWISREENILEIAKSLGTTRLRIDLLEKLLQIAISRNNVELAYYCFKASIARRKENSSDLEARLIQPVFRFFNSVQSTDWIREAWFLKTEDSMFMVVTDEALDAVFTNLVFCARINDNAEWVLAALASRAPRKVIDFFGQRLSHSAQPDKPVRYSALPFEFHRLRAPLAREAIYLLDAVRRFFVADKHSIRDQSVRLLTNVFPDFPTVLLQELLAYARSSDENDVNFVLEILRDYPGSNAIHEVAKELVDARLENDPALNELRSILWSSGVVAGEFGFVDALKTKIADVRPWLEDDRERVKAFAQVVIASFEKDMVYEQRRAEQDRAMGRLEWE